MYCAGMIGSGDTKLGSVLAAWVGLKGMIVFLFYMTLLGGILGAASLWMKKKKPFPAMPAGSWIEKVQSGNSVVPYGIAISFGAWAAFFHTGFLHHRIDEVLKIIH
jgi:Flp pilus assembly protein protease CpaA